MGSQGNSLHETKGQDWEALAKEYTKVTAHTSLKPIGTMLERANALLPFSKATGILDNGCGPGPVMKRLIEDYGSQIPSDCPLLCADFSEPMLQQVKNQKAEAPPDSPWHRVDTKVQNAMDLNEVSDSSKSHVTAGMVYFMTPDPMKCLAESKRVLKDGGVLSLSSWEGSQWQDLMFIVYKMKPELKKPELPKAWQSTDGIEGEMKQAGFKDVEAHRVPVDMPFESHESFVYWVTTKLPHMVTALRDASEEETQKIQDAMIEECKKMCPQAPGLLKGVAVVGLGKK